MSYNCSVNLCSLHEYIILASSSLIYVWMILPVNRPHCSCYTWSDTLTDWLNVSLSSLQFVFMDECVQRVKEEFEWSQSDVEL